MPFIPSHGPNCQPDKPESQRFPRFPCPGCGTVVTHVRCTCVPPSRFFLEADGNRHELGTHGCFTVEDMGAEHKCEYTAARRDARETAQTQRVEERLRNGTPVTDIRNELVDGWKTDNADESKHASAEFQKNLLHKEIMSLWVKRMFGDGMTYNDIWVEIDTLDSNEDKQLAYVALRDQRPRPRRRN